METNIVRGETPSETRVEHVFCSRPEKDRILLHGWNAGLPACITPLSALDEWHLMWYKINAVGNILCGYEYHGTAEFDKKVMVCNYIQLFIIHPLMYKREGGRREEKMYAVQQREAEGPPRREGNSTHDRISTPYYAVITYTILYCRRTTLQACMPRS